MTSSDDLVNKIKEVNAKADKLVEEINDLVDKLNTPSICFHCQKVEAEKDSLLRLCSKCDEENAQARKKYHNEVMEQFSKLFNFGFYF